MPDFLAARESRDNILIEYYTNKYIEAYIAYAELSEQKAARTQEIPIKGSLITRKVKRKKGEKIYHYTYYYIQTTEYTKEGRKTKRKYVKKENIEDVKRQFEERKEKADQYSKAKKAEKEQRDRARKCLKESLARLRPYIKRQVISEDKLTDKAKAKCLSLREAREYRERANRTVAGNPRYRMLTEGGELVQSKNECIVANMLKGLGAEYYYEKPLSLKPKKDGSPVVLHPDFTVKAGRKEIYIEILGMLENEEYAASWEYRAAAYRINGIRLGENLAALSFPNGENGRSQEIDCPKLKKRLKEIVNGIVPGDVENCGIKSCAGYTG